MLFSCGFRHFDQRAVYLTFREFFREIEFEMFGT